MKNTFRLVAKVTDSESGLDNASKLLLFSFTFALFFFQSDYASFPIHTFGTTTWTLS
jgi:hypothetical protein